VAQTSPIDDDPEFRGLEDYINNSLAGAKGYGYLARKGSSSWIDKRIRPVDAAVRYKLCFWNEGDISFGLRKKWADEEGFTAAQLQCPDTFTVQPSTVVFIGFKVNDDDSSRQKIARVISMMP
jgi:hypothetical protein